MAIFRLGMAVGATHTHIAPRTAQHTAIAAFYGYDFSQGTTALSVGVGGKGQLYFLVTAGQTWSLGVLSNSALFLNDLNRVLGLISLPRVGLWSDRLSG